LHEFIRPEKPKAKNRSAVIDSAAGKPTDRDCFGGRQAAKKRNERNPHLDRYRFRSGQAATKRNERNPT